MNVPFYTSKPVVSWTEEIATSLSVLYSVFTLASILVTVWTHLCVHFSSAAVVRVCCVSKNKRLDEQQYFKQTNTGLPLQLSITVRTPCNWPYPGDLPTIVAMCSPYKRYSDSSFACETVWRMGRRRFEIGARLALLRKLAHAQTQFRQLRKLQKYGLLCSLNLVG